MLFELCRGWGLGDHNLATIADEKIGLMLFDDHSFVPHERVAPPNKMTPPGALHRFRERRAGYCRKIACYAGVARQMGRSELRCLMR